MEEEAMEERAAMVGNDKSPTLVQLPLGDATVVVDGDSKSVDGGRSHLASVDGTRQQRQWP